MITPRELVGRILYSRIFWYIFVPWWILAFIISILQATPPPPSLPDSPFLHLMQLTPTYWMVPLATKITQLVSLAFAWFFEGK